MAHALAIVIGDDWEAAMQAHCIRKQDGTEGDGQFDSCERGGRFGRPFRLWEPRARRGLLRFLGVITHTAQARRSQIDVESVREHDPVAVVADGKWHEVSSFDEARRLIDAVPGDPLLTAVDYHL